MSTLFTLLAHSHRSGLTIKTTRHAKPALYFFYIDESGNTGLQLHPTEPVHWLVAVAAHARALRAIEAEMSALAVRYFGVRAYDVDFEFHGAYLFSGRHECKGMPPGDRVQLFRELVALLRKHDCTLFVRGVDKPACRARAAGKGKRPLHPHALAFRLLVERIDGWLEVRQTTGDPVLGLLVADEQKEVDREMVRSLACWRAMGNPAEQGGSAIRYLIDTVHYVPSTDSWLLQLADCVTYLRNRYEKILRGKILPGEPLTAADQEVVSLWEVFCRPAVESEVLRP